MIIELMLYGVGRLILFFFFFELLYSAAEKDIERYFHIKKKDIDKKVDKLDILFYIE